MAMLVATSPPPLSISMDSVFAAGHAPPSPAYSSPPHPASPISPKDGMLMSFSAAAHSTSGRGSSTATSTQTASSSSSVRQSSKNNIGASLMTPTVSSDALAPVRPAKDIDEFMSRLPPRVEFVEGSSSGAYAATLEGRYEPVNASPKAIPVKLGESQPKSPTTPVKKVVSEKKTIPSLHTRSIDLTWPAGYVRGSGLINIGNTCFLNSALQCMLHTPPLLQMLHLHTDAECHVKKGFCMSCAMRRAMQDSFGKRRAFTPYYITQNLSSIAKHFKRGRQEDSHEFLRYAIDALQKSCLAGYPSNINHKLAETSWVHMIFGGRLRSRVTCHQCGYNSDTFDRILDLSVDIYKMASVKDALRKFTAKDYLKGADKYKCEKCKRPVNAEKHFTIHEAPVVLTVHLKRFTPMGRKLQHPIQYSERVCLQPLMSEGQHGPWYTLYGVISHVGGGPNSGHYFAHVRAANGQWYEMNDDSVEPTSKAGVLDMKNAYVLFYIRDKGEALAAALKDASLVNGMTPSKTRKNTIEERRENNDLLKGSQEAKTTRPFIGPVIPTHLLSKPAPQPDILKRKIEVAEREKQNRSTQPQREAQPARPPQWKPLVEYEGESDEEEQGEPVERPSPAKVTQNNGDLGKEDGPSRSAGDLIPSSSPDLPPSASKLQNGRDTDKQAEEEDDEAPPSSPAAAPPQSSSLPGTSPTESQTAVSPKNFYGSSASASTSTKRKSPDGEYVPRRSVKGPSLGPSFPLFGGGNPFGKSRIGDTLKAERTERESQSQSRDEDRELFRPRKIHKKQFGSRNKFAF